jgi:hypothetical protein
MMGCFAIDEESRWKNRPRYAKKLFNLCSLEECDRDSMQAVGDGNLTSACKITCKEEGREGRNERNVSHNEKKPRVDQDDHIPQVLGVLAW